MRPGEFFVEDQVPGADPWTEYTAGEHADLALLEDLRRGPASGRDDLEVAVALAQQVHDDLTARGTGGGERLTAEEIGPALRALRAVLKRLGLEVDVPFRDYSTFHDYWVQQGCHGNYQCRRDLLRAIFEPVHAKLFAAQDRAVEASVAFPVSPRGATGWRQVDSEVEAIRRRFGAAQTAQDYRAVGNDCVHLTEALSRQVYDPAVHLQPGEDEPPAAKTKQRLTRYVELALPAASNAGLRKLLVASIEMAQQVKHDDTPTRREAGLAADSVILLAHLLRRLAEPE